MTDGSRMHSTGTAAGTQPAKGRASGWAERLVRQREGGGARDEGAPEPAAALAALWSLFDEARDEANTALNTDGVAEGIALRDEAGGRRYCTTEAEGEERFITILPMLPGGHGHDTSAYIGASSTRATMYLVPTSSRRGPSWQVAATGRAFDVGVVQDLFLSVFADDAGATSRLSPLSGSSYFQTPWD